MPPLLMALHMVRLPSVFLSSCLPSPAASHTAGLELGPHLKCAQRRCSVVEFEKRVPGLIRFQLDGNSGL